MHAPAFLVTVLLVSFLAPKHTAAQEGAHKVVKTPGSLQLSDRAVFNAICSSPNEPALARANSHFITNICCHPDHPIGGWIDIESKPICCSQSSFATTCSQSEYKGSVKPANVVGCDGPRNIPIVLAKNGIKICQVSGIARMSQLRGSDVVGVVGALYLPGEVPHLPSLQKHTIPDSEEVVNGVEIPSIENTPLSTRRDLITAECFHNYAPTLAHHDPVSTINICCPYIFPQGGWHFNTDPICCPAGTTKDDCSKNNLLHVNADNVKRCLGPGNVPVGTRNSHVNVCKALSAGGNKREVPTLDNEGLKCENNINFKACHLKHHPPAKHHTSLTRPETETSIVTKRLSQQLPITCPSESSPQILKDLSVIYVGIYCPKGSAEPAWLDGYSTPTCCVQGVNQRECLQHMHRQTLPIVPANCDGSCNGTYNEVEVCKWLPESSGSTTTIDKRSLLLILASDGTEADPIGAVTLLKWLVGVGVVLAMVAL